MTDDRSQVKTRPPVFWVVAGLSVSVGFLVAMFLAVLAREYDRALWSLGMAAYLRWLLLTYGALDR